MVLHAINELSRADPHAQSLAVFLIKRLECFRFTHVGDMVCSNRIIAGPLTNGSELDWSG